MKYLLTALCILSMFALIVPVVEAQRFDFEAEQVAGGGAGTPGGADTNVQYNDGGAFGGDASFVYDPNTATLSVDNLDLTSGTLALPDGGTGTSLANGTQYQLLWSDGDGTVSWSGYTMPSGNGSDGQVMTSDGAGGVAWEDLAASSWVGTATSDLDMASYVIKDTDDDQVEITGDLLIAQDSADGPTVLTMSTLDDDGTNDGNIIEFKKADTGPGAVVTDDLIGRIVAYGYGATQYNESGRLSFNAAQGFTDSNFGTYLDVWLADDNTSTLSQIARFANQHTIDGGGIMALDPDDNSNYIAMFYDKDDFGYFLSKAPYYMKQEGNLASGDLFRIEGEGRLQDDNAVQRGLYFTLRVNQSSTGAYQAFQVKADEDAVGDGTTGEAGDNVLAIFGTNADPDMVYIDHDGQIVATASGIKLPSGVAVNEFSTDDTFGDDSDSAVPTEQTVKAYVDTAVSGVTTPLLSVVNKANGDTPYTMQSTDEVIRCDTSGGVLEVDLIECGSSQVGQVVNIKCLGDCDSNNVTVDPNGTDQIDEGGAGTAYTITGAYDNLMLLCGADGYWDIL